MRSRVYSDDGVRAAVISVVTYVESGRDLTKEEADLSGHNRELLSRIAGILLVSKGFGLSIFGYTDDVGSPEYNQQLSLRRANKVKAYLVQSGIDAGIINVKGFGKTSPLVDGKTDEQRSKNRRVEIALTDSSVRFQ